MMNMNRRSMLVLSVMSVSALHFGGNAIAAQSSLANLELNSFNQKSEVVEVVTTAGDLALASRVMKASRGNESIAANPAAGPDGPIEAGGLILDQIINIGTKIWNILEKGKPVFKLDSISANALPKGAEGWDQLQGWSKPVARAFKYSFGGAVACRFLVVYNYGGNVQGKGKYLSEVAIIPTGDIHVAFGYTFDMQAKVRSVVNEGSDKAPVAAMQLAVSFSSSTSFANFPHHRLYYINGAGEFQDLTNGNLN